MTLKSGPAWLTAVAMLAGGFAHGSDGSPPPCIVIVSALQTDVGPPVAAENETRTESVTLLVRGMRKSRSGAT